MWFTPVREQRDRREQQDDSNPVLLKKVMDITDVVVACRETGLDWFEQLLNTVSQDGGRHGRGMGVVHRGGERNRNFMRRRGL